MLSDAEDLMRAVKSQRGGKARPRGVVAVNERLDDQAVWQGSVQVFDLEGHPAAIRAYAWSSPFEGSTKRRFFAVLHMCGSKSPADSVRAAIVVEHRSKEGSASETHS